jgi:SAM-dependent methyltransferase
MKQDPAYTVFAADFAAKNRDTTKHEIKFLDTIFKRNNARTALDVACGAGRLTFPLDALGYKMSGVDLSSQLIRIAKEEARKRNLTVKFSVGDMRKLRTQGRFDAAICMWGSFTYLESIDDMLNALRGMNKNLKKGGILIIDVAPGWHEIVVSKVYKLKMYGKPVKNGRIDKADIEFDPADQFSLQHDEYVTYANGKIVSRTHFDRKRYHFTPTMFDLLLRLAGFEVMAFYSDRDIRKKLPQKKLKRLIAVAKKI